MSAPYATHDWPRGMFTASSLLALGCFLLLIGSSVFLASRGFLIFVLSLFGYVAGFVHLAAWLSMGRALWALRGRPVLGASAPQLRMASAFAASLVGFGLGIATLPLAFPVCGWTCPAWLFILVLGAFPYIPTVFGPVLAAHSALFLVATATVRDALARKLIVGGSGFLAAVAIVGLTVQLVFPTAFPWALHLAGLSGLGYLAIAAAWHREAAL